MRADGVKIPQADDRERRVRPGYVGEDLLDHPLRPAVGIRTAPGGHVLGIGNGVVRAVDRRRRAEYETAHVVAAHRFEQGQGRVKVVAVVLDWLLYRLPHRLEAREMYRRVNRLLIKHLRERRAVRRVDPVKRRAAAGNLLDAVDHVRAAVREVVRDDDVIAVLQQLHGDVRADKARAAGQ